MSLHFSLTICVYLLLWGGLGFAAEGLEWEALQARKKEFSDMKPEKADGEAFDLFVREYSSRAGELADAFRVFHEQNPTSKEGREAWRQWLNYLDLAAQRIPGRKAELVETEKRLLADPSLSKTFRESIRWNQADRIYDLGEREQFVRSVEGEFSGTSFISHHLLNIAEFTDAKHARALVDEVLKMPRSEHEREYWEGQAKAMKEKLERIGQPMELKFTAVDGRKIDLKDYRGKVVLLDFWATWCGPCIAGLPKLREIWQRHRGAGFEVICISYDSERKVLEKFVEKNSIPWPQFFSEEGNKAELVTRFGKPGPPAYWLVDRNGKLAEVSAWNDLEGKVKQLLAQKKDPSTDSEGQKEIENSVR
jgi:thiol-disulfide isomerase/thioredoxin